jgi:hypothetical protein
VLVGFKEETPGAGEILDQWMVSCYCPFSFVLL